MFSMRRSRCLGINLKIRVKARSEDLRQSDLTGGADFDTLSMGRRQNEARGNMRILLPGNKDVALQKEEPECLVEWEIWAI